MTIENIARHIQEAAIWLTDGPKKVFSDVGAMSDTLKLPQLINTIANQILSFNPFPQAVAALGSITDFISARGIIGRVADLISFKGASTAPLFNGPNYLWIANKVASLAGDIGSSVKWLASVNVFGEALSRQITNATVHVVSWGNPFNALKGVGDFSCITSSLFDLIDVARQSLDVFRAGGYVRNGVFMAKTAGSHALGLACDVAKVAGSVLSNIPGVGLIYPVVAASVGALTSLGKFFVQQYCTDQGPPPPPNGGLAVAAMPYGGLAAAAVGGSLPPAGAHAEALIQALRSDETPFETPSEQSQLSSNGGSVEIDDVLQEGVAPQPGLYDEPSQV